MRIQFLGLCFIITCTIAVARGGVAAEVYDVWDLNEAGNEITPGTIYVLENGKLSPVLNLLREVPLNELGAWVSRKTVHLAKTPLFNVPRPYYYNCRWYWSATYLSLPEGTYTIESVGDPFACLEILNRVGTGLIYNHEAEIRTTQWRETLVEYIRRSEHDGRVKILQCVETMTTELPEVIVEGSSNEKDALMICNHVLKSYGISTDLVTGKPPLYQVKLPQKRFVLQARFRELKAVRATTHPQVQFAHAEDPVIGLPVRQIVTTASVDKK